MDINDARIYRQKRARRLVLKPRHGQLTFRFDVRQSAETAHFRCGTRPQLTQGVFSGFPCEGPRRRLLEAAAPVPSAEEEPMSGPFAPLSVTRSDILSNE